MITLTTPISVSLGIGGGTVASYNRFELTSISMDALGSAITGSCRLVASATPSAAPIIGTYTVQTNTPTLSISIPSLNIAVSIALGAGAITSVLSWITGTQNTVEAGMVSIGIVTGTQSTGM